MYICELAKDGRIRFGREFGNQMGRNGEINGSSKISWHCMYLKLYTVLLLSTCFKSLSHGLRTSVDTKWLSDFNCVADPNYFGGLHMLDMTDSDPAHVLLLLTLICSDTIQKIYDNWYYFCASRSGIFLSLSDRILHIGFFRAVFWFFCLLSFQRKKCCYYCMSALLLLT